MVKQEGHIGVRFVVRSCFADKEKGGEPGDLDYTRLIQDKEKAESAFQDWAGDRGYNLRFLDSNANDKGGLCDSLEDGRLFANNVVNIDHANYRATITYFLTFCDLTTVTSGTQDVKDRPDLFLRWPDSLMDMAHRRDSGNGPFLASGSMQDSDHHFVTGTYLSAAPGTERFNKTLDDFVGAMDVRDACFNQRIGEIGSNCHDFYGMSMSNRGDLASRGVVNVPRNLGEFIEAAYARPDDSRAVTEAVKMLSGDSKDTSKASEHKLTNMGKLLAELIDWKGTEHLDSAGYDCWIYQQNKAGVCACSAMAYLNEQLFSMACENDFFLAYTMNIMSKTGKPAGGADIFNCVYSSEELPQIKEGAKPLYAKLKAIADERGISVEYLIDNMSMPFHCGVWPADLTGDAAIDLQVIMEKFVDPGESIGCRTAYMKPGVVTTSRVATTKEGETVAYVFTSEALPNFGVETFGNYGFIITPEQQQVMDAIHGDYTRANDGLRAPFTHHGGMVHGDVADTLIQGYKMAGIKVMDLRVGKGYVTATGPLPKMPAPK